jgi:hypothetical protein
LFLCTSNFGCSCAAGILLACKDKSASSSSLKIEALTFLRAATESNAPAVFQPHVAQLSSGVFAAVGERYYKVWRAVWHLRSDACCITLILLTTN